MITSNKLFKSAVVVLALFVAVTGCKKTDRPALGDYPVDANPPGGPLKFYVAFDGTTSNPLMNGVDSTRANFPAENTGSSVDGVSGKAFHGDGTQVARYAGANEFTKATSFTIAYWIKKTPQDAATHGTNFVFCLNTKDYSWTNTKLFVEFENSGQSTTALAACKFYIMDNWIEYVGANRMPNVLDGTWHHMAFTYNQTGSELKAYIDGVLFRTNTVGNLGAVNFGDFNDFTIGGPNDYTVSKNTWMEKMDGSLDQFRLYGTVLTQAEIMDLVTNKK